MAHLAEDSRGLVLTCLEVIILALRMVELAGDAYEMGYQFGSMLAAEARGMTRSRLELCEKAVRAVNPDLGMEWCLEQAALCVPFLQEYSTDVYREFCGIAEAAGLTLPELVIGNGYTDVIDLLVHTARKTVCECTAVAVGEKVGERQQVWLAQTWDMHATARPYMVLVRRRPKNGPRTISLTTAGCLSLIGMNEFGVAVGNTNLQAPDARPGVFYLAMIHKALAQECIEEAIRCITGAERLSGHYYYLGGPDGEMTGIETSALEYRLFHLADRHYAHTNHYLHPELCDLLRVKEPGANTADRLALAQSLLKALPSPVDERAIAGLLSSHHGENCLCRHEKSNDNSCTCGAVVMCPVLRTMWVTGTNPCENTFAVHGFDE